MNQRAGKPALRAQRAAPTALQAPAVVSARSGANVGEVMGAGSSLLNFDQIEALAVIDDAVSLRDHVQSLAEGLGFHRYAAVCVREAPGGLRFESIENVPPGHKAAYYDTTNAKADPIANHYRNSSLPIVWDQHTYTNRGLGAMWELAAPFGYRSGIAVSIHMPGRQHFVLGFDSAEPRPCEDEQLGTLIAQVQLAAVFVHDAAFRLLLPEVQQSEPDRRGISPRELEALRWVAAGKTAWEIGVILSISEATVTKHLAACVEKLGCVNRTQAVARAITKGLISP